MKYRVLLLTAGIIAGIMGVGCTKSIKSHNLINGETLIESDIFANTLISGVKMFMDCKNITITSQKLNKPSRILIDENDNIIGSNEPFRELWISEGCGKKELFEINLSPKEDSIDWYIEHIDPNKSKEGQI